LISQAQLGSAMKEMRIILAVCAFAENTQRPGVFPGRSSDPALDQRADRELAKT
jgi:hypothetical protein